MAESPMGLVSFENDWLPEVSYDTNTYRDSWALLPQRPEIRPSRAQAGLFVLAVLLLSPTS